MALIELPHSHGCLVCGHDNPRGLHLHLNVDDATGRVVTEFTPEAYQIGFEAVVHGGALATVIDEVMVWAATWKIRRFCLCAELTTRFRHPVAVGMTLTISAEVEFHRPKMVETVAKVFDSEGTLIATSSGKYMPMPPEQHRAIVKTLVVAEATAQALAHLKI